MFDIYRQRFKIGSAVITAMVGVVLAGTANVGYAAPPQASGAVALSVGTLPSSAPSPPSPGVTSGTLADLQAMIASAPKPTKAQLALAKAMFAKHAFQGAVKVTSSAVGVTPDVSVGVEWWGIWMYFTKEDIHNIWDIIWAAGIGAAAAILCAPGGWLAVACAIVGAVLAYIVAEIIWNYIGYYVPDCGVYIDYSWTSNWSWGSAC